MKVVTIIIQCLCWEHIYFNEIRLSINESIENNKKAFTCVIAWLSQVKNILKFLYPKNKNCHNLVTIWWTHIFNWNVKTFHFFIILPRSRLWLDIREIRCNKKKMNRLKKYECCELCIFKINFSFNKTVSLILSKEQFKDIAQGFRIRNRSKSISFPMNS